MTKQDRLLTGKGCNVLIEATNRPFFVHGYKKISKNTGAICQGLSCFVIVFPRGSIPIEWLKGSPFLMYACACGTLLARAHARSGDIAKIAGYCGKSAVLDEAIASWAEAYGDQTERDFQALLKAISSGQVAAEMKI